MKTDTTIEPGFYQYNVGGASLAECWRMSRGLTHFLLFLFWKITRKSLNNFIWLPVHEALKYCDFNQLGDLTKEHLGPQAEIASTLGFHDGQYLDAEKVFSECYVESGSYIALHQDRKRILNINFSYSRLEKYGYPVESGSLTCVVSFYDSTKKSPVSIHNHNTYFDYCGDGKICYLKGADLKTIAQTAEMEIEHFDGSVLSFRDIKHYDEFLQPLENELWIHRINRGLFIKVISKDEITSLES